MFNEQEKGIIIMALMYFKNDCSVTDIKNLGFDINGHGVGECDDMVQVLIENFVGPTWDEQTTDENIKRETEKRTRK
tara:strand:+ start:203 stop:433 length:231 start_codon:yes stop_codon:yes gene_type:complete